MAALGGGVIPEIFTDLCMYTVVLQTLKVISQSEKTIYRFHPECQAAFEYRSSVSGGSGRRKVCNKRISWYFGSQRGARTGLQKALEAVIKILEMSF